MAIPVPQEVLERALRNAPLSEQKGPRFGSIGWWAQSVVGNAARIVESGLELRSGFFGSINVTPDPNLLSLITFNNWTNTENPAGTGSQLFTPLVNPGVYGAFTIAGGSYTPNYLYLNIQGSGSYYTGYINTPSCPLSGWFVSVGTNLPLLYNSAADVSPLNIPSTGWFKTAESRPGDTIVSDISSYQLPFVPYLFNRINTEAYTNITSDDYFFDQNTLEFYANNNSLYEAITGLNLIQFDGTGTTKVKMDLTDFSNLVRVYNFLSMSELTDFALPINDKLEYFGSAIFQSLTSFKYKPGHIYPKLQNAFFNNIRVNQLNPPLAESSNFYDDLITSVYSAVSSGEISDWRLSYPIATLPSYFNPNSGQAMGRSSASDDVFLKLIALNPTLASFELDSYFPIEYLPTGTYYPHTLGDTLVIQSPVSAQGSTFVFFNALSGIYTKTGDIKDNRDVFRNENDYFVMFDEPLQRWTVVGPLSTSSTLWLSAQETIGDYGNIPKRGWGGPAFRRSAALGPPWSVDTCVYSTQTQVFSGIRVINGRYGYNPYQGFNNDSCWKDLDFSGIGYNATTSDPEWNGKITLVSPVHFMSPSHFPASIPEGSLWSFVHKDGSVSTRSVLSSINIDDMFDPLVQGTTDLRIGILNEPVSAACYSIGNYFNFCRTLSAKSDYANLLLGPTSTGEVSQALVSFVGKRLKYNAAPSNYFKFSSLPKSKWYSSGNMVGGESSTGMWARQRNNQLSLLGLIKYADFSSDADISTYYDTLFMSATSLCNRFYGSPFVYSLTAANPIL